MRLRNDSGYPLNSGDLGRQITAWEEFDSEVYITGCTRLDAPKPDDDGQVGDADDNPNPGVPGAGTRVLGTGDGAPARTTKRAGAARTGDLA